eukprot:Hpha_TRINITY_DN16930_c1_g1::TRINITY_DN16930_c1_g1_i4::g.53621::m.53621
MGGDMPARDSMTNQTPSPQRGRKGSRQQATRTRAVGEEGRTAKPRRPRSPARADSGVHHPPVRQPPPRVVQLRSRSREREHASPRRKFAPPPPAPHVPPSHSRYQQARGSLRAPDTLREPPPKSPQPIEDALPEAELSTTLSFGALLVVQSAMRRFMAKKRFREAKEAALRRQKEEYERSALLFAAILIQTRTRGLLTRARRRIKERKESAAALKAAAVAQPPQKGEQVRVTPDIREARLRDPGWVDAMDVTAGQAGVVTKILDEEQVLVRVGMQEWIFNVSNLERGAAQADTNSAEGQNLPSAGPPPQKGEQVRVTRDIRAARL